MENGHNGHIPINIDSTERRNTRQQFDFLRRISKLNVNERSVQEETNKLLGQLQAATTKNLPVEGQQEPILNNQGSQVLRKTNEWHPIQREIMLSEKKYKVVKNNIDQGNPAYIASKHMTGRIFRRSNAHGRKQKYYRSILGLPILDPNSLLSYIWCTIITVLDLIYATFAIPVIFALSFDNFKAKHDAKDYIEIVAGCFYIINIVFELNTGINGVYKYKEYKIMDGKLLASWYLKSFQRFGVDFVAVVPFFAEVVAFGIVRNRAIPYYQVIVNGINLIRCVRVFKMFQLANLAIFDSSLPTFLNANWFYFSSIIYTLGAIVNFLAAIWYILGKTSSDSWISRIPDIKPNMESNSSTQYLMAFYYAFTTISTLGYGDFSPQTAQEMAVNLIFQLVGVVSFSTIVSYVAALIQNFQSDSNITKSFRQKATQAIEWMNSHNIDNRNLKQQVLQFYGDMLANSQGIQGDSFSMEELPGDLRDQILYEKTSKVTQQTPILNLMDKNNLKKIALKLEAKNVLPEQDIYCEQDMIDKIWILEDGVIHQFLDMDHTTAQYVERQAPDIFGVQAAIAMRYRKSNLDQFRVAQTALRTGSYCKLWFITLDNLQKVFNNKEPLELDFFTAVVRYILRYTTDQDHKSQTSKILKRLMDIIEPLYYEAIRKQEIQKGMPNLKKESMALDRVLNSLTQRSQSGSQGQKNVSVFIDRQKSKDPFSNQKPHEVYTQARQVIKDMDLEVGYKHTLSGISEDNKVSFTDRVDTHPNTQSQMIENPFKVTNERLEQNISEVLSAINTKLSSHVYEQEMQIMQLREQNQQQNQLLERLTYLVETQLSKKESQSIISQQQSYEQDSTQNQAQRQSQDQQQDQTQRQSQSDKEQDKQD